MTSAVVGLEGVSERIASGLSEHGCPSRAVATVSFLVLDVELLIVETAFSEVEVDAVGSHEFGYEHGLVLTLRIGAGVAKHETASFGAVSMKVNVHLQLTRMMLLYNGLFGEEYGRMLLWSGLFVAPVQILTQSIKTPVSSGHTVRIQNRDDLKDVVVEQSGVLSISKLCQLVDRSLKHVRGGSLAAVDSPSEVDDWLFFI